MKGIVLCTLVVAAVSGIPTENFHPLSEEYIVQINEKATTWKAGKNFDIEDYERVKRMAAGVLNMGAPKSKNLLRNPHDEDEKVPESFDSRIQWSKCKSLREIRDQSACGSCWALATTEAMSDRICIHSNQVRQTRVSAEDLTSCCDDCGYGCFGGFPEAAWNHWRDTGIVTGGLYKANQGCKDYTLVPCEHHVSGSLPQCTTLDYSTPDCIRRCQNSSLSYRDERTFGQQIYSLENEKQIQLEIIKNGPISVSFTVYDDFLSYKSGVYQRTSQTEVGGHAVKCIGWGVENNVKYWLIANSWNEDWGDKGYFKIIRGKNECDIERNGFASLPKLN